MTVKSIVRNGSLTAALLASCSQARLDGIDIVNIQEPNAVTLNKMGIKYPDDLISETGGNIVNLSDPKQVAAAMGVELNGDPNQLLYEITIGRIDSAGGVLPDKTIPVTVANVKEASDFLNGLDNLFVTDRAKAVHPDRFKDTPFTPRSK